jgi:hypothetical protein
MQLFFEEYTCFLLIGDGSIPILSVMLATDSIDLSVNNFLFLTDSIDRRSEKNNFSSINRTIGLGFFFSAKDHRSNRCFLQLIDYRYRSNRCFFRHRCPSMHWETNPFERFNYLSAHLCLYSWPKPQRYV